MLLALFAFLNAWHNKYQTKENKIAKIEVVKEVSAAFVAKSIVPDMLMISHESGSCACHKIDNDDKEQDLSVGLDRNKSSYKFNKIMFVSTLQAKDMIDNNQTITNNIVSTQTGQNLILLC